MRARTTGAAAATAGHSFKIASQSWGVSVMTLPLPKLTPLLAAAPGCTSRLSAPILAMVFLTDSDEPWPISTTPITAAMPMTMPSVVSAERMMLRVSALMANRNMRMMKRISVSPPGPASRAGPAPRGWPPHRCRSARGTYLHFLLTNSTVCIIPSASATTSSVSLNWPSTMTPS